MVAAKVPARGRRAAPNKPGDNPFWHNVMHTTWDLSSPTAASLWP